MGRIHTPDMMARRAAMRDDIRRAMPSAWLRGALYVWCKFMDAWRFGLSKLRVC